MTTFAGTPGLRGDSDGTGTAADFVGPLGITIDAADNLYVTDPGNGTIRKITPGGVVTTIFKSNLGYMIGIALDSSGNIYVIDGANKVINKITSSSTESVVAGVLNIAGQLVLGPLPGSLYFPSYLVIDGSGTLYVTTENVVVKIKLH